MSYRQARGTVSQGKLRLQQHLACAAAALGGAAAALILFLFLGWEIISPALVILTAAAALVLAILSRSGTQNEGEVYFPRSDGLWIPIDGGRSVDARFMTGSPPASELSEGFRGGYAAATVLAVEPSQRRSAGEDLSCVTFLVAAPNWQSYRTRVLMHRRQGDEYRLQSGHVLLAGRFSMVEPDIALLSQHDIEELSSEDRALASVALAAARDGDQIPVLPIRDSRSFRLVNFGYNNFWNFWFENPPAIWADLKNRGDWARRLLIAGYFLGSLIGTAVLILLVIFLMLLVPVLDGSGPNAYN